MPQNRVNGVYLRYFVTYNVFLILIILKPEMGIYITVVYISTFYISTYINEDNHMYMEGHIASKSFPCPFPIQWISSLSAFRFREKYAYLSKTCLIRVINNGVLEVLCVILPLFSYFPRSRKTLITRPSWQASYTAVAISIYLHPFPWHCHRAYQLSIVHLIGKPYWTIWK